MAKEHFAQNPNTPADTNEQSELVCVGGPTYLVPGVGSFPSYDIAFRVAQQMGVKASIKRDFQMERQPRSSSTNSSDR